MARDGSLLAYVLARMALAIPMLLILLTAVFIVLRVLPGDPILALWGGHTPPQPAIDAARQQLGLDQPIPVQYVTYLRNIFTGNFGLSIGETYRGQSVWTQISTRFPATLEIAIGGMAVASLVGIPLGVLGGSNRDKPIDLAVRMFGTSIWVIPIFWLGLGLQFAILFAGAVLTEKTFSIEGIGILLLNSVTSKDMTMIQGVVVFYATIIVIISLVIDVIGAMIDPRIRL